MASKLRAAEMKYMGAEPLLPLSVEFVKQP